MLTSRPISRFLCPDNAEGSNGVYDRAAILCILQELKSDVSPQLQFYGELDSSTPSVRSSTPSTCRAEKPETSRKIAKAMQCPRFLRIERHSRGTLLILGAVRTAVHGNGWAFIVETDQAGIS